MLNGSDVFIFVSLSLIQVVMLNAYTTEYSTLSFFVMWWTTATIFILEYPMSV